MASKQPPSIKQRHAANRNWLKFQLMGAKGNLAYNRHRVHQDYRIVLRCEAGSKLASTSPDEYAARMRLHALLGTIDQQLTFALECLADIERIKKEKQNETR